MSQGTTAFDDAADMFGAQRSTLKPLTHKHNDNSEFLDDPFYHNMLYLVSQVR